MKKIFTFILLGVVVIFAGSILFSLAGRTVSGIVVDSATGQGIPGVIVTVSRIDWGFNGYLVWDKNYIYTSTTDAQGKFAVQYRHGDPTSIHLQFQKAGYHSIKEGYPLSDIYIDSGDSANVSLEKDK